MSVKQPLIIRFQPDLVHHTLQMLEEILKTDGMAQPMDITRFAENVDQCVKHLREQLARVITDTDHGDHMDRMIAPV